MCNENSFSPGDLGRFIDRLKVEGYNTRLVFVDYLDTMNPTVTAFGGTKEYDSQGAITQELRALSRIHSIPIISPTQNQRTSEDMTKQLNNLMIGDSYKKIRYTDYMYMIRMREDKNFLSEDVKQHVLGTKNESDDKVNFSRTVVSNKLVDVLVPLEIRITKSKNSEKNKFKYMLFCKENLRIYNNIDEYLKDSTRLDMNTSKLLKEIDDITDRAISSTISSSFPESSSVESNIFSSIMGEI